MATQTLIKKIDKDVTTLKKDMGVVKTLLAATYRDPEGEYRPAFVKKMIKRMASRGPFYRFTNKENFLRHVRAAQ